MPQITSIEPQKKKPDRFNIFVDGKFAFGLDAETLVKSGLKVGQKISEKEIEKLVFENETNKLLEKALRFLSFRPRSEREVRDYLKSKTLHSSFFIRHSSNEVIANILGRLKHLGYIDDLEFTRWWVEQRQTHKPRGVRLIRSELYQKGVAKEIVDKVLLKLGGEESEIRQARAAAKKKLKSYKNLKVVEFRQKMGQYLARRGFNWETITKVLDSLVDTSSSKGVK